MKSTLAALGSGAAATLLLYGFLAAVRPRLPDDDDPWLRAWAGAGHKVQFQALEGEPGKRLLFVEGRELFKRPGLENAVLRRYSIDGVNAQVVRIAPGAGLEEITEGRHVEFRLRPKGGMTHVTRLGNLLLFLSNHMKVSVLGDLRVSKGFVERVFDVFEETAGRTP